MDGAALVASPARASFVESAQHLNTDSAGPTKSMMLPSTVTTRLLAVASAIIPVTFP
jgi:hypothetical protein